MNTEELFFQLQDDLAPYKNMLSQAVETILNEDVSKYPIIVAAREAIELGIPLVEAPAPAVNLHASTLEEFVTKGLVEASRVDRFREVFKDPEAFVCVFLIAPPSATFVFLPR
ncbi:MAG: hypothetical protein HKN16_05055 [Saprospiraceae bacterium]|nr:hypothetical protein [Saprospiraceae bacterium]